MIKTLAVLLLLAASLPLEAQDTNSLQSWSSSDGKIIQAKFIRMESDAVVIERDGKPFTISFTKLAPESVELAKRLNENTTGEGAATTQVAKKSDREMIFKKLHRINVTKIEFEGITVREAIDFLHQRSIELDTLETDPGRKGVRFVFNKSTAPEKIDALRISNLRVNNLSLITALKYVCDETKLRYIVEGSQVTLIPQAEYATGIHSRTFTVPPDFLVRLAACSGGDAEKGPRMPIIQYLEAYGVAFPEGASATLSGNQLEVSNTWKELYSIEHIVGALAADAVTAPTIQFRWLQSDPKTADALVDVIKAGNLSAEAFSAKIAPQISNGKITEVASFDRKIISGQRFVLRPVAANLPLVMEAEATVSQDGLLMDLRCVPEWTPTSTRGSGLLRCNTALTLSRKHWSLFARWGDGKADTLLLACGGSELTNPAEHSTKGPINGTPVTVHLDAEWRETSADDLAKLAQAPPESRAKALAWLRGRSTLLASATGSCRSGQRSRHEHLWGGKSDAELKEESNKRGNRDPKEAPPRPGVSFDWDPTLMGKRKEFPPSITIEQYMAALNELMLNQDLSLRLRATYIPLNSKARSQVLEFEFQGMSRPNEPEFVAAKAAPGQNQPVVVLVLTPWYEIIR